MDKTKIAEIDRQCNNFLAKLKCGNDTSDDFGKYTAQLNTEELRYCAAVFEILEAYHYGFIDQTECTKRHEELIRSLF